MDFSGYVSVDALAGRLPGLEHLLDLGWRHGDASEGLAGDGNAALLLSLLLEAVLGHQLVHSLPLVLLARREPAKRLLVVGELLVRNIDMDGSCRGYPRQGLAVRGQRGAVERQLSYVNVLHLEVRAEYWTSPAERVYHWVELIASNSKLFLFLLQPGLMVLD